MSATMIPSLLEGIENIATSTGTRIATFGHAADGSMHPTMCFDAKDERSSSAAMSAFNDIVTLALALALDGTITGEHGVGLLKREQLRDELSPTSLLLQAGLRRLFDPDGLLNPGKVFSNG